MRYSAILQNTLNLPLIAILLLLSVGIAAAQQAADSKMKPGIIVLTAFAGDVKITTTSSNETHTPSKGATLKQGQVIVTGPNSKALLAYENGIVMEVSASSKFVIQEFQQSPWDVSPENLKEMKTEPSQSKTTAFLEYGDIITGVKKLKPGSSFDVTTPLGSAGIRGTDFKASASKNSNGTPNSFSVGVASGEVGVRSAGSTQTVSVPAGTSSNVSMPSSQAAQSGEIPPPTTGQLSAEAGSTILSSVTTQRSGGEAVFSQALVTAAQNRESASDALSPAQQKTLQEAAENGDPALIEAVTKLTTESPLAAAEIAAAASELAPEAAPQIASAAALVSPTLAARIASSVARVSPSSAAAIATSVAQAVPASAADIAGAVASVAPSQAPQIALAVAMAVPEAAADIAQSVASAQPQQASQIAKSIIEGVAGVNTQAVGDAARTAAEQANNTNGNVSPPPPTTTNPIPPLPPAPTPAPTPSATPMEVRSPR